MASLYSTLLNSQKIIFTGILRMMKCLYICVTVYAETRDLVTKLICVYGPVKYVRTTPVNFGFSPEGEAEAF